MTAMIDNNNVPDPRHPGQMMVDYGNCPGGGRPELIARMMAVRDVYRRRDLKDVVEERKIAAIAADAAPRNAALMARANALWLVAKPGIEWNERKGAAAAAAKAAAKAAAEAEGKSDKDSEIDQTRAALAASAAFVAANPEPPLVKWNIDVPKTKAYADPLHSDNVNDPDFNGWLDGEQPAAAAPAAAPNAYNRPRPNKPANLAQKDWNVEYMDGLTQRLEPLMNAEKQEYLEMLLQITQAEIAEQPENAQININLVNALLVYAVYTLPIDRELDRYVVKAIATAILLGGDRVKRGMDPDVTLKHDIKAYVTRVEGQAAAPAPVNALEAAALAHFEAGIDNVAEGGRRTYKRRKGLPKKKTRVSRRH
jgi:hypothetical protein